MPLISAVHIDLMLTNISVQFKNPGYIAEDVMPIIPVKLETSKFFTYDKTRFDAPPALRAERALYARVEWSVTTSTYSCQEYGLELLIDDRERQNAIEPLNIDIDTTEILTDMVLNDREVRVKTTVLTSGSYTHSNTTNLSGLATAWDQFGTSDPIKDLAVTAREQIRANAGIYPNTLVLGAAVFSTLKQHPIIQDRLKYNPTGGVSKGTIGALADLFEVDRVLVGLPLTRSSNEGQTDALSDVWGKNALMAWINPRPAIKQPTLSYMFQSRPRQVYKYRDDFRNGDVVRVSEVTAEQMIADTCGYLFQNVIS